MPAPEFWIVAGPNGAGKTTLVQAHPIGLLLPDVPFLNPDDIALELLHARGYRNFLESSEAALRAAFLEAAGKVEAQLRASIQSGQPIGVETVLSSDKYRPIVSIVRKRGGFVGLIYVALASPDLACRRVRKRAQAGGHDVPLEKIRSRWARSLANLAWFAQNTSAFWVFDNSNENPKIPPTLVASGQNGRLSFLEPSANEIFRHALAKIPRSAT
jgi:predicted ABC-type ATPase